MFIWYAVTVEMLVVFFKACHLPYLPHLHAACPSGLQHLFVWGLNHLQAASEHTRKSSIGDSSRPAACRDATEASATGDQPLTVRGGRGKSPGPTICSVPRQVPLPVPGVKVSRIAAGWAHTLLVTGGYLISVDL